MDGVSRWSSTFSKTRLRCSHEHSYLAPTTVRPLCCPNSAAHTLPSVRPTDPSGKAIVQAQPIIASGSADGVRSILSVPLSTSNEDRTARNAVTAEI